MSPAEPGREDDLGHDHVGLWLCQVGGSEVRRFNEASTACQAAAAIYRETEDRHNEGVALNTLAGCTGCRGG
jgi:hypothetical protein